MEKKTLILTEEDFDSKINHKRTEIFSLEQKIKALHREKDNLATDSADRVKLGMKKDELDAHKKKLKKMYVYIGFLHACLICHYF